MSQPDLFDDSQPLGVIGYAAYAAKLSGDDREWRRLAKKFGQYDLMVAVTGAVRSSFAERQFDFSGRHDVR